MRSCTQLLIRKISYMHGRFSTRDGNFKLGQKHKRFDVDDEAYSENGMYFVSSRVFKSGTAHVAAELVVSRLKPVVTSA